MTNEILLFRNSGDFFRWEKSKNLWSYKVAENHGQWKRCGNCKIRLARGETRKFGKVYFVRCKSGPDNVCIQVRRATANSWETINCPGSGGSAIFFRRRLHTRTKTEGKMFVECESEMADCNYLNGVVDTSGLYRFVSSNTSWRTETSCMVANNVTFFPVMDRERKKRTNFSNWVEKLHQKIRVTFQF